MTCLWAACNFLLLVGVFALGRGWGDWGIEEGGKRGTREDGGKNGWVERGISYLNFVFMFRFSFFLPEA